MKEVKMVKKKDNKEVVDLKEIIQELFDETLIEDRITDLIKTDIKNEDDVMYASSLIILKDRVKGVLGIDKNKS